MTAEHKRMCSLVWQLIKGAWNSEEKWRIRGMFLLLMVLNVASVYLSLSFNEWDGAMTDMVASSDAGAYGDLAQAFLILSVFMILVSAYEPYIQKLLQIKWRIWMTNGYLERWLKKQSYYRMKVMGSDTDNPDQRISEDISLFAELGLTLFLNFVQQGMTVIVFSILLWNLSPLLLVPLGEFSFELPGYMFWSVLIFSIGGTFLGHLIGRRLIPIDFDQQRYEADFRFSMMRARENSESIAFYGGEQPEGVGFKLRFANVIKNYWELMKRTKLMNFYNYSFIQVGFVFPILMLIPGYFSGALTMGMLMQAIGAFGSETVALAYFVNVYTTIAEFLAVTRRLSGFTEHIDEVTALEPDVAHKVSADPVLALDGLQVQLPNGRTLLQDCSVSLQQGSYTLITGSSGCGKSTLLRTIAGLWPFGHGTLELPEQSTVLFLPQRPYLPLGTLRRAICYPGEELADDAQLSRLLQAVGMERLAKKLDQAEDWSRILSLGEQQRIAFARVLLAKPQWAFLDESTSALDESWERTMYGLLKQELPETGVVSVGHRSSLFVQHDKELHLAGDGGWQLKPIAAAG